MHIDKELVLGEIRKHADDKRVQEALSELPEKIDHEKHAHLLQRFGVDPGALAEKAARKGISSL